MADKYREAAKVRPMTVIQDPKIVGDGNNKIIVIQEPKIGAVTKRYNILKQKKKLSLIPKLQTKKLLIKKKLDPKYL